MRRFDVETRAVNSLQHANIFALRRVGLVLVLPLLLLAAVLVAASPAAAAPPVVLPPVNLGGSRFMDAMGGPGILVHEAVAVMVASRFTGADGKTVPGINSLRAIAALTHIAFALPQKVLGGHLGAGILLPVVHIDVLSNAGEASADGLGDLIVSPIVFQAPHLRIFGRPLFQRFAFDLVLPTGAYRNDAAINIGNNVFSVNPNCALTFLFTERVETSWRIHYLWNSVNSAPRPAYQANNIQPGQAVHFNAALSYGLWPALRIGVAGYYLKQITDHAVDGRSIAGSKEQVAAVGPGLSLSHGTFRADGAAYWEFAARNRPVGRRLSFNVFYAWLL